MMEQMNMFISGIYRAVVLNDHTLLRIMYEHRARLSGLVKDTIKALFGSPHLP